MKKHYGAFPEADWYVDMLRRLFLTGNLPNGVLVKVAAELAPSWKLVVAEYWVKPGFEARSVDPRKYIEEAVASFVPATAGESDWSLNVRALDTILNVPNLIRTWAVERFGEQVLPEITERLDTKVRGVVTSVFPVGAAETAFRGVL